MAIDFASAHEWIARELRHDRPIMDSMRLLIDLCEQSLPHTDWQQLRNLSYGDLRPMFEWLQTPFRAEPPSRPLRGLWFGLFNPIYDGRNPVADIYVCGSERFNADDATGDWATGPDWWPEHRYAQSQVLADIYRIAYPQENARADTDKHKQALGNDAEYPLCLGYGAFAVREVLRTLEPMLLLGDSISLGVAVGFDSGDFVLLGSLDACGLKFA